MNWRTILLCIAGGLISLGIGVARIVAEYDTWNTDQGKKVGKALDWVIEFYLSLIAYFVLHLLIVTSSDFVDAFNIPPLNIGIYVDKLAAIRALLMVIADIFEYGILDKAAKGSATGQMQRSLLTETNNPRRIGSIISFLGMLACRIAYLCIVYKSDNKSLSVFISLCIEGFWFGVFQMSFFAIGPEYNALTSLGIHTMGNFIFFLQLIMQGMAKTKPEINSLYRVRVHAWICFVTTTLAFLLWLCFCLFVTAKDEDTPSEWPGYHDVWSPFLLFIVGAFAEDFAVPGLLPFAFLDTERVNLVNYLTPVFFMSGAIVTVLANDFFAGKKGLGKSILGGSLPDLGFKDWSAMSYATGGRPWHALWLLNVPKYIAFFISMFGIHGTFGRMRCIVQCRWRVLLLTMNVVVPRATLETAGYVGVANYAIGRGNGTLACVAALAKELNARGFDKDKKTASDLEKALGHPDVKSQIVALLKAAAHIYGVGQDEILATDSSSPVTVTIGFTAEYEALVGQLAEKVGTHLTGSLSGANNATQIAPALAGALIDTNITPKIKDLVTSVAGAGAKEIKSVSVEAIQGEILVKINAQSREAIGTAATVTVKSSTSGSYPIKIQMKGLAVTDLADDAAKSMAIGTKVAKLVAAAFVSQAVKNEVTQKGYTEITALGGKTSDRVNGSPKQVKGSNSVQLKVSLRSDLGDQKVANGIGNKIKEAAEKAPGQATAGNVVSEGLVAIRLTAIATAGTT